ncbi:MAG: cytochrome c peroxidase [Polyangiaceae bacterium]
MLNILLAAVLAVGLLAGCEDPTPAEPPPLAVPEPDTKATAADPFVPIPRTVNYDVDAAALGEQLFADPILSDDGAVRCTDCQDLSKFGGGDGKPVPDVPGRKLGLSNSTTVFNVALFFRYGWIGAHDDMEHHLDAPMRGERVMGIASWEGVVERVRGNADYAAKFRKAYPGKGVTEETLRNAIAEYQTSLITPDSDFDRYLRTEGHEGLKADAKAGYELFKGLGCVTCHQGMALGGNMFQKFGVMYDFFPEKFKPNGVDEGRYRYTQNESDMHVFRVPSLRNVAVTGPYFHNGEVTDLREAVQIMVCHQLGLVLEEKEVMEIVAFLESLTGTYEGKRLESDNAPYPEGTPLPDPPDACQP